MIEKIKNLFKQSVIYSFGNLSGKVVSFLLLPIYTRYLTPAEYGILAIVHVFSSIFQIIGNFGFRSSVVKVYFEVEKGSERNEVISTAFFSLLGLAVSAAFALWLARERIAVLLLDNPVFSLFIGIAICSSLVIIVKTIPLSIFRAKEKAIQYSIFAFLTLFLGILLNLLFVIVLRENVKGILKSALISQSIVLLLVMIPFSKNLVFKYNTQYLKAMLTFGFPLIPSELAIWILTLLDRYFLRVYTSMEIVGVYSLGYKIGTVMSMLVIVPFSMAWSPLMLKWQKEPNAHRIYANIFKYFCSVGFFAALALSLFSKEIIRLMTTPSFFDGYKIVYFVAASCLFRGFYMIFTAGCTFARKTFYFAIATGAAAILNTILNILLIPRFEMIGAAVATIISFFMMTALMYAFSERYYHIPFDFWAALKVSIIATGLYLAGVFLNANLAISILVKVGLVLSYFPLLVLLGVFSKTEVVALKAMIQRRLRR
jgi:O-antigen/teichoic acid export membrane protein